MGQFICCFMLDRIDLPAHMDGKGRLPVYPEGDHNKEHHNAQIR